MSDFEDLISQIHKSLEQQEEIPVPQETDYPILHKAENLPEPEEIPGKTVTEGTAAPAEPAEKLDVDAMTERLDAPEEAEAPAPATEDIITPKAEAKPAKKRSMFRKPGSDTAPAGTENDGFSSLPSFADRYSTKDTAAGDSAFSAFRKKTDEKPFNKPPQKKATANEKAVLEAAILGTQENTEEPAPAEGPSEDDVKIFTPEDIQPSESGEEEVRVADKSAILQQLATADNGELGDEELQRIDDEVADSILMRDAELEEEEDEYSEDEEEKTPFFTKVKSLFTADAVKNWRLRFDHLDPSFNRLDIPEYTDPAELPGIMKALAKVRRKGLVRLIATAAIALITIIINIVVFASSSRNGEMAVFGGSRFAYALTMTVMLLASAGVMFEELRGGVYAILRLKPKVTSVFAGMYAAGLLQCIGAMFTSKVPELGVHMLTGVIIALSIPLLIAKELYYSNIATSLKRCHGQEVTGVLREVEDAAVSGEMLRDDAAAEKTIRYPATARFIKGILSAGADASASDEIRGRVDAIFAGVSIVTGIIGAIAAKSLLFGVTAMTGALCFSFPVVCLVAGSYLLDRENEGGKKTGTYITSTGAAKDASSSENIVVNDDDIFTARIVEVQPVNGLGAGQAQFVASILANRAGGVLAKTFAEIIEQYEDRFPKVEEFACENRLGVSGWIEDSKILLGNSVFMENHSIEIPAGMAKRGKKTERLFLSINGAFAACFELRYSPAADVINNLQGIVKQGTNLIIIATDPNLSDDAIEKMLSFPTDSVRVINAGAIPSFEKERSEISQDAPAGILFRPGFAGFMDAAGSALRLVNYNKIVNLLTMGTSAFGLVLAIIFAFTGSVEGFSIWVAIILQLVFLAAGIFVPDRLVISGRDSARIRPVKVTRNGPAPVPQKPVRREPVQNEPAPEEAPAQEEYTEEAPEEAQDEAPVYVAVNETPDPSEASVEPLSPDRELTPEEQQEELDGILDYLDRTPRTFTPHTRKSVIKDLTKKAKQGAEKLKEQAETRQQNDYAEADDDAEGFDDYGGYGDDATRTTAKKPTARPVQRNTQQRSAAQRNTQQRSRSAKSNGANASSKISGALGSIRSRISNTANNLRNSQDSYDEEDYTSDLGPDADVGDYDFNRYYGKNMFSGLNEDDK